jgi:hypothetical protein
MKNATPTAATYSVVVRDPNSWFAATGIHQLVRDCGHAHKTPQAADKCAAKLLNYHCNHGRVTGTTCSDCHGRARANNHSANWHLATIERSDGVVFIVDADSGNAFEAY